MPKRKLKVIIPTRGRSDRDKQRTLNKFTEIGISPLLVGNSLEDIPKGWKNYFISDGERIRGTRQDIWERFSKSGPILMIDDDLVFHKVVDKDGKRTTTKDFDFREFVAECELLSSKFGLSGIHSRFMINMSKGDLKIAGKNNTVTILNRKKIIDPDKLNYRLEVAEDLDFQLQYLTQGNTSAVSCKFAYSDKQNAEGGCSIWRESTLQCSEELASLWPEYVSINKNGVPVIQFKKAWKENQ